MSDARVAGERFTSAVQGILPQVRTALDELIKIPSVSAVADNPEVENSAALTERLFANLGGQTQIIRAGGAPAVVAHFPADPAWGPAQTKVLLYAHHDVQPEGDHSLWSSDPFEPTERGERLYGRGSADDKAGIAAHLAALSVFNGKPPVDVTVFIEGEEEVGSPSLIPLLEAHKEQLEADVIVIADSTHWDIGAPALTVSLRGVADFVVEVTTLNKGVHSGIFGGPVPDALTALIRLLATLHDSQGNIAVPDLPVFPAPPSTPVYSDDRLRAEAGLLPEAGLIGSGPRAEQLWYSTSISVLAIDSPSVANASNTLHAQARAKVGVRVPPGADVAQVSARVQNYLLEQRDWPVAVRIINGSAGQPFTVDTSTHPAYEAFRCACAEVWGVECLDIGMGGSIPFLAEFSRAFPKAGFLVTGVEDPSSGAHGPNESLHLGEFVKTAAAEALLLEKLGGQQCRTTP